MGMLEVASSEALFVAPLCPTGHLPHLGGDRRSILLPPIANNAGRRSTPKLPVSPLVGEMSGRTEGGNVERCSIAPDCFQDLRIVA